MNIKAVLSAIALTAVFAAPALAASFSFNRADADRMVNFAKEEGISLPKDVAENIVKYSQDRFGRPLCAACQKKAAKAEKEKA